MNAEIAVKKAQPWTIMASYNRIQGVYGTQNSYLLTQLLKKEWGFKGIVMTDWFGGFPGFESISKGSNSDVVQQMIAGNDLLMPGIPVQKKALLAALDSGKLSQEVAKRKITVNAVAPGFIVSDMTSDLDETELKKMVPANRFGKAEEVAYLASFLASDKAAYITGEVININGGIYG